MRFTVPVGEGATRDRHLTDEVTEAFLGSSLVWLQPPWKGGFGFQDEVLVVAEPVSLAFDDFDAVVYAFQGAGVDGIARMVDDAVLMSEEADGEALKGCHTAAKERAHTIAVELVEPNRGGGSEIGA